MIVNRVDKKLLDNVIANRRELPEKIPKIYLGYEFEASIFDAAISIGNNDISSKTRRELSAMNSYLIGKLGKNLKSAQPLIKKEEKQQVTLEVNAAYEAHLVQAKLSNKELERRLFVLNFLLD